LFIGFEAHKTPQRLRNVVLTATGRKYRDETPIHELVGAELVLNQVGLPAHPTAHIGIPLAFVKQAIGRRARQQDPVRAPELVIDPVNPGLRGAGIVLIDDGIKPVCTQPGGQLGYPLGVCCIALGIADEHAGGRHCHDR
jgi:hypothetical protein